MIIEIGPDLWLEVHLITHQVNAGADADTNFNLDKAGHVVATSIGQSMTTIEDITNVLQFTSGVGFVAADYPLNVTALRLASHNFGGVNRTPTISVVLWVKK